MAEPRWLSARELEAWEGFLQASTLISRRVEQQLKDDARLSHSQYEVLVRLAGAPGGELRMTELAGIAKTSKSGLTYQVAQLEKAGLVRRVSTPSDDRGVVAKLTAKGKGTLQDVAPAHAAMVRELFLDGLTHKQFAGFADGIRAVRQWLLDNE
jgi:DNA-binding MarR family transcriptional regulator